MGEAATPPLVQSVRLDAGNALNSSRLPRGYAPRRCAHSPFRPVAYCRRPAFRLLRPRAFWCLLPGVL